MPGWTLIHTDPIQGRTFHRPLSDIEDLFLWVGLVNGYCDILRYYELRISNRVRDADLFSDANIVRAWLSTKRRNPLAGATIRWQGRDLRTGADSKAEESKEDDSTVGLSAPHFVVRDCDLSVLRPGEIVFEQVTDAAEAQQRAAAIFHGPRPLSKELLVKLYVARETGSEKARADILHVMVLMSHCVADGIASRVFIRCFLDTLARGASEPEPAQVPLEDRLAMVVSVEELEPAYLRALSPARRRWRRAAATVIFKQRSTMGRLGGHTIPCRRTRSTENTTSRPGLVESLLTEVQSKTVIAKCRQHNIAFGSAYLPLAQVAMTRVLYRRYLRGEISEEEWAYRKRQPHINHGGANLRPYLDKTWFEKGGGGEFMMFLNIRNCRLPFMTLGGMDRKHDGEQSLSDGAPPFSDLLTFDRFLHRAGLVKKQATAFFNHPLFFELKDIMFQSSATYFRDVTLKGMKGAETGGLSNGACEEEEILTPMDIPSVVAHAGTSLGNMDPIFPFEYPLPPTNALSPYSPVSHPSKAGYVPLLPSPPTTPDVGMTPTITVECARTHNHVYSGELYLGAETWRGQLKLFIFYDGNVYEEGVVREWLDEVRDAVLWYLDH